MLTLTDAIMEAILTLITDTAGPFDPAALYLGVANTIADNGAATVQADVTPATAGAATRKAVTPWSAPYKLADGRWAVQGPTLTFAIAGSSDAQIVRFLFLNSALTAGTLKAFGPLPVPFTFVDEFSLLSIVVRLTVDPEARWSAEVVWNG